jgi:CO dehydrogenase maturation factor
LGESKEVEVKKISVCGKGGSGKSTITALLADAIQGRGYRVLVVDSDESNPGLYRMLGLERRPKALLELVGGKKNVFTTFSGEPRPSPSVLTQEEIPIADIPHQYIAERDGVKLVCIGKVLQSLEGCACPMGALSREFLKRLSLEDDEVAIVDMEAGIEHFGRGVDTSLDGVLIVVEPSLDSLQLAEKIHPMASELGIDTVWAILNKAMSDQMASRLRRELVMKGISVLGSIGYDPEILQFGLDGRSLQGSRARRSIEATVDQLLEGRDPCA